MRVCRDRSRRERPRVTGLPHTPCAPVERQPQQEHRAEDEERTHPTEENRRFQSPDDPQRPHREKGERESNRNRSRRDGKPPPSRPAPLPSCGLPRKGSKACGHDHVQQRHRTKTQRTLHQRRKDNRSKSRQREAVQRQKPGRILPATPNSRQDRTCARRQRQVAHVPNGARRRPESSENPMRVHHEKVNARVHRIQDAAQC
jgi:hypothetical protein